MRSYIVTDPTFSTCEVMLQYAHDFVSTWEVPSSEEAAYGTASCSLPSDFLGGVSIVSQLICKWPKMRDGSSIDLVLTFLHRIRLILVLSKYIITLL
jgi:hypothetical protein